MLRTFGPLDATTRYPTYTAEEVAALRKQPLLDVTGTRANLVERMAKSGISAAP